MLTITGSQSQTEIKDREGVHFNGSEY